MTIRLGSHLPDRWRLARPPGLEADAEACPRATRA
jgi:hypothetical protein